MIPNLAERTWLQSETRDQPDGSRVANQGYPGVADLFAPKNTESARHRSSQARFRAYLSNKFVVMTRKQEQPKTLTDRLKTNQAPFAA